jgi:hypothetical protein
MFFIGNFGSDRFGDKGAACVHYGCYEELTEDEVNHRLSAHETLKDGVAELMEENEEPNDMGGPFIALSWVADILEDKSE